MRIWWPIQLSRTGRLSPFTWIDILVSMQQRRGGQIHFMSLVNSSLLSEGTSESFQKGVVSTGFSIFSTIGNMML